MAVSKNHKLLLKKLKKQVALLKRKEEKSRAKLQVAVKKIQKLSKTYKIKLATKMRGMKTKIAAAQDSTYAKVASNLEKQISKSIDLKRKALLSAAAKIDKKHLSKLTKGIAKKGKQTVKRKKRSTKK